MPPQVDPRIKELNDQSMTWLIVAIAGFVTGFGFITGPLAWIKAGRVRANYRQMGMAPDGGATAAWIIGMVTTIMYLLSIFAVAAMFLFLGAIFTAGAGAGL